MKNSATNYTHISIDPETCGGMPHVQGARVRVVDVVALHERGLTPVEVLDAYEHLTLGQVHAVLAYYYDHAAPVDAQFEALDAWEAEFRRDHADVVL